MSLSEQERSIIASRAGGSYADNAALRQIVSEHKKNKSADDAVFLAFARLVCQKSFTSVQYETLQKQVLALVPYPFGVLPLPKAIEEEPPKQPRRRRCGLCGTLGHNARGCPSKPDTPTMTHNDGIERLPPGFDPNPPKESA